MKSVGKLSNDKLRQVFFEWNKGKLLSFLIEITADTFGIKDDKGDGYLVDKVLDKTGMKGSGKWTVQQAAESSMAVQLQHLWIPGFSVDLKKEFRLPEYFNLVVTVIYWAINALTKQS